jgi:DNA-binding NarL/FixJ family response regulator
MIRVYVVGEIRSYVDALEEVLRRTGRVEVVGAAVNPLDAVGDLPELDVDVVLLDIGPPAGPAWAAEIRAATPEVLVVVLGLKDGGRRDLAWAEAGVAGFVGSQASLDELVQAVEGVARLRRPSRSAALTVVPRQTAVHHISENLDVHLQSDAAGEVRLGGFLRGISVVAELPAPRPITQFRAAFPQGLIRHEDARPRA